MAQSPLYDIFDPGGELRRRAQLGLLDDDEEREYLGVIPLPNRRPQLSNLLPEEEKRGMLRRLSEMGTSGLAALGYALDTPGAFVRGALAGNPLSVFGTTEERVSGRDLLRQYGLVGKDDNWYNFAGGLASEIVLDPFSFVNPLAIFGRGAATAAGKTLARANLLENASLAARDAGMGPRQYMRQTAREIIGDNADDMDRFRRAAEGYNYNPEQLLDQRAAGLAELKLPWQDSGVSISGGRVGDAVAQGLDTFGEALSTNRYTAPVVNRLTASFDPTVMGAVDRDSQWRNREAFASRRDAERQAYEQIATWTRAAEQATPTGVADDLQNFYSPRIQNAIRDTVEAQLDPERIARLSDQEAVRALESTPQWRDWRDNAANYLNTVVEEARVRGLQTPTWQGLEDTGFFPSQAIYWNTERAPVLQSERLGRRPSPYTQGARTLNLDDVVGRSRRAYTDIPNRAETFRRLMANDPANPLTGASLQQRLIAAGDQDIPDILDAAFDSVGVPRPFQNIQAPYERSRTTLANLEATRAVASPAQQRELDRVIAGLRQEQRTLKTQLGDLLRQADTQFAERGVGLFDRSAVDDLYRYASGRAKSFANRDVVLEDLLQNAVRRPAGEVPSGGSLPFLDAADRIGFDRVALRRALETGGDDLATRFRGALGTDFDQISINETAVEPLMRMISNAPREQTMLGRAFDDFTAMFKLGALFSPAYHTRNAYSGFFANLLGGADNPLSLAFDTRAGRQLGLGNYGPLYERIRNAPGYRGLTEQQAVDQFLTRAARNRLGQGQVMDDVALELGPSGRETRNMSIGQDTPERIVWRDPNRDWRQFFNDMFTVRGTGRALRQGQTTADVTRNPLIQLHERAGRRVEEANRLGLLINQIRRGADADFAARQVSKAQIDYGPAAFTDFERRVKRAVPFYSYTRGILPLIGENLLYSPGGLQSQTIRTIARGSEPNEDRFTPEFLRQSAAIPIPYSPAENLQRYVTNIDLPFASAVNLISPGEGNTVTQRVLSGASKTGMNLLGQLNPVFKAPLEWAFNRQLYTGREMADLYSVLEQDLGELGRPLEQFAVNFVPGGSKAIPIYRTLRDQRLSPGDRALKLVINNLLGAKVTDVDQERTRQLAARTMLNEMLASTPGVRKYENIAVPDDVLAAMPREQQQQYLLYRIIQSEAAKRARERKKTQAALDPMQVLGVVQRF